jgi:tetratricopeptide (TPR) repeat protein
VDACEATHVRGEQSGVVLDARMRCLDQRLAQLGKTVELLGRPDAALADAAPNAVQALANLAECNDAAALTATPPPPTDPAKRAAFDDLTTRIASQRAANYLRHDAGAAAAARQLVAEAKQLDHCLVLVEARLVATSVSSSHAPDGAQLAAAAEEQRALVRDADRCGADVARARALGQLIETLDRIGAAAAKEVDGMAAELRSVSARLRDPQIHAAASSTLARLAKERGDLDGAIALGEEAVRVAAASGEVDPAYRIALAAAYVDKGKLDAALEAARTGVEDIRRLRGADHPSLAVALQRLAHIHGRRGEAEASLARLREALALLEGRFGAEHRDAVIARANLGGALIVAERHAEARPILEASLIAARRVTGPEHPLTTSVMSNLVKALVGLDAYPEAEQLARELVEIRRRKLGAEHPQTAVAYMGLARVLIARKKYPEAIAAGRDALALQRPKLDPKNPVLGETLLLLGSALVRGGKPAEAIGVLEEAIAIFGPSSNHNAIGEAEYRLGTALWDANRDRARARKLIAEVAARDRVFEDLRQRARTWLAAHP